MYIEMDFVHFHLHGILLHEYIERTTPEQRTLYLQHYMLHITKQAYWNTPENERRNFGKEPIDPLSQQIDLNAMIEASIAKAREAKARQEEQSKSKNGTKPKRKQRKPSTRVNSHG